tara:strand:- start:492 stop:602 length:111 start_codon:yes stop_codon:yes gene_type:complete
LGLDIFSGQLIHFGGGGGGLMNPEHDARKSVSMYFM